MTYDWRALFPGCRRQSLKDGALDCDLLEILSQKKLKMTAQIHNLWRRPAGKLQLKGLKDRVRLTFQNLKIAQLLELLFPFLGSFPYT